MELFKQQIDSFMVHIPYRGIAPAFTDLIGGQTQAMFPGLAAAVPHIRSGRVRPLAVTGLARHPLFKDVPTLDESGYKGFDAQQWYGVVGPAGMPARGGEDSSTTRWPRVLSAPDLREKLSIEAVEPKPMTPGAVRRVHARRHRALDAAGQGPQHPARQLSTPRLPRMQRHCHAMARNTQVAADHNAPPVTQILAQFVATHPSRGWSDAVDHEAHRTFINWVGCAVGAAHHETAAGRAGRRADAAAGRAGHACWAARERVDMASAALVNGITSHTFDFDDTHLKTIIHPAGPVASAAAGAGRAHGRQRPRADRRAGAGHRRVAAASAT